MTDHAKRDRAIKGMSAQDRESLRDAQQAWTSPEVVATLAHAGLKEEVLRDYKRLRKCGQDPDSALFFALDDWGLACSICNVSMKPG